MNRYSDIVSTLVAVLVVLLGVLFNWVRCEIVTQGQELVAIKCDIAAVKTHIEYLSSVKIHADAGYDGLMQHKPGGYDATGRNGSESKLLAYVMPAEIPKKIEPPNAPSNNQMNQKNQNSTKY